MVEEDTRPSMPTLLLPATLRPLLGQQLACLPEIQSSSTPSRNNSGLSVLLQYKLGSTRQDSRSATYAVPDLRWLGLRPSQLDDLDLSTQVRIEASSCTPDILALRLPAMSADLRGKRKLRASHAMIHGIFRNHPCSMLCLSPSNRFIRS